MIFGAVHDHLTAASPDVQHSDASPGTATATTATATHARDEIATNAHMMAGELVMATPDLRGMSQPPIDQDISATLSDFLTYTEHLPSTIVRSLTLIQSLNRKADALQLRIHNLLTTYALLPSTASGTADPVQLRREISNAYEKLEECKLMSAAEAARVQDSVTKDGAKLDLVQKKLKALPMPPSRDPTPEPGLTSPQLRKNAHAHQAADRRTQQHRTGSAPRVRSRKIMVPGEVLPPPNPDSPPPSDFSNSPSPPPASPDQSRPLQKLSSSSRQKTPKLQKIPKEKLPKTPRIRVPGSTGTNAHSAVAGISTSNALMALTAPPPGAMPGSKWLPWKRLTEYEMATLRKRMKKNAIWLPSPAMRNRELKNLGRGATAMEEAKATAEASGKPFIDDYDPAAWSDPTRVAISGEEQAETNAMLGPEQTGGDEDDALINRGMRLNEAKKLKREKLRVEEQPQSQSDTKSHKQDNTAEPKLQDRSRTPKPQAQPEPSSEDKAEDESAAVDQNSQPAATPSRSRSEQKSKKQSRSKTEQTQEIELELESEPNIIAHPPRPESEAAANPGPITRGASQTPTSEAATTASQPKPQDPAVTTESTSKKRKRDITPLVKAPPAHEAAAEQPEVVPPQPKKLKLSIPVAPQTDKAATSVSTRAATANAMSSPANTPVLPSPRMSTRPRSQRASVAPDTTAGPAQIPAQASNTNARLRRSNPTIIIRPSKAASAEPPNKRSGLRRSSNASLPGASSKLRSPAPNHALPATAAAAAASKPASSSRSRRPVPGLVTTEEDGSAKVSVGKRKAAPKKKAASQAIQNQQSRAGSSKKEDTTSGPTATEDEAVDPDEPRYCVCNDVSWGTMIACDNDNCEKEWFHLECVKLEEMPPRRTKWYCPDCRKRLKVGLATNGIVR